MLECIHKILGLIMAAGMCYYAGRDNVCQTIVYAVLTLLTFPRIRR